MSTLSLVEGRKSYLQYFLLGFIALFLAACNPTAKFSFTPDEPVAGAPVTFDAAGSSAYKPEQGNTITTYDWYFSDGVFAQGQVVEHTFAEPGEYVVKLKVTDAIGRTNREIQRVTVAPAVGAATTKVSALVQTSNGALLTGADVTVNDDTTQTNEKGLATLDLALEDDADFVVVRAAKQGFITQSVRVPTDEAINVALTLQAVKQTAEIADIAAEQTIEALDMHATISLPADAFVKPDGSPATGVATVEITPWDIASDDLNAMPANGKALDNEGNLVDLISAGMLTTTFYDADGKELQLADGKQATLQMDLPLDSINNQALAVGDTIPLWYFNEEQGLWLEEGVGQVVASTTSSTGLAVQASVSHFSTWNWDFKWENGGSVFVQCQESGTGVPCYVTANVTLGDGSGFTRTNTIPAEGATVINMPTNGSIEWSGTSTDTGLMGNTTSSTSGTVIIPLSPPATDNIVSCVLLDGSATDCLVTLNDELNFSVAASGSRIVSYLNDADDTLEWTASKIIQRDGDYYRATGAATSATSGSVTITLDNEELLSDDEVQEIKVMCVNNGTPETSCTLTLDAYYYSEGSDNVESLVVVSPSLYIELDPKPFGTVFTVSIPIVYEGNPLSSVYFSEINGCTNGGYWDSKSPDALVEVLIGDCTEPM